MHPPLYILCSPVTAYYTGTHPLFPLPAVHALCMCVSVKHCGCADLQLWCNLSHKWMCFLSHTPCIFQLSRLYSSVLYSPYVQTLVFFTSPPPQFSSHHALAHYFLALQPSSSTPALMNAQWSLMLPPLIPFSSSSITPSSLTLLLLSSPLTLSHCYPFLWSLHAWLFTPINLLHLTLK